ncbi:MAG: adenylate/guanylate cyclase domain-containing protein [Desulfomonile tiedjei]|nr:adenylate/guanylate cyclase domain-containing protein [Desulfomonile tiedjei]
MDDARISLAINRLKVVPAINLVGNLVGAAVTFAWFAIIRPGFVPGAESADFHAKMVFFGLSIIFFMAAVAPVNMSWWRATIRNLRNLPRHESGRSLSGAEVHKLAGVAGEIVDLPVKLVSTSSVGWVLCGLAFFALPALSPALLPWDACSIRKMGVWVIFAGAPTTAAFTFLLQERWLRSTIVKTFPPEALRKVSGSFKINVLPKMLGVTLLVGTLPAAIISHTTLEQIHEIQANPELLSTFLTQMPLAIGFLLMLAIALAIGLAVFMAKSVSEPLQTVGASMEMVGTGNLTVSVPVVCNDEIGALAEGFNRMLDDYRKLESVRDTFGRYVSTEVVTEILKSPAGVKLGGELRDMTVLVADLRGFTRLTEALDPQTVLEILNRFLESMTEIIMKHGGTIDEFTGDGILVFFGAPRNLPDHALCAVACAVEMQEALSTLNREGDRLGLPALGMGIGINCGELVVGNIGCEKRRKYGALGTAINVAFRVEALTQAGEILLTATVHDKLAGILNVSATREVSLKGIETPVTLYQVLGLRAQDWPSQRKAGTAAC